MSRPESIPGPAPILIHCCPCEPHRPSPTPACPLLAASPSDAASSNCAASGARPSLARPISCAAGSAPANLDLAGAEIELVPAFSREMRLKNAIAKIADDFDLILIDCPPSLGLLTVNALAAAKEVLVPIQCEYYALEGLGQLLRNVDLVQRNLNAELHLSHIVLVMFDARTNLASQVATEVREHFGDLVCKTVIPRTVRLSEAPSFGQPITVFDTASRGALSYRDLAREVAGVPT